MTAATVRTFRSSDQEWFAHVSGDRNPLHLDALAARKTQAGVPVVHGMHAVLWALEAAAADGAFATSAAALDVHFERFVEVDAEASLRVARRRDDRLRIDVAAAGLRALSVEVAYGEADRRPTEAPSDRRVAVAAPLARELDDLADDHGVLAAIDAAPLQQAFAASAARLDPRRLAALAQLSTLVGMVAPGQHSIFAGAALRVTALAPAPRDLAFRVVRVDARFRLVEIAVVGDGIAGSVEAFVRQPPVRPPSPAELAAAVAPDAFAGTRALVVGGSRGLGALTARLLLAGGAHVTVGYAVGADDAREVVAIAPERAALARYDVTAPVAPQLGATSFDHLYYFATPRIFRAHGALFEPARFAEFCRYYVDGFWSLVGALLDRTPKGAQLAVFYPSSVAVAERPREMTEYAMAKAAGETLCADLARFERRLRIVVRRLPRVLTDQTATVVPVESAPALETLLPIVRAMHADQDDARNALFPG